MSSPIHVALRPEVAGGLSRWLGGALPVLTLSLHSLATCRCGKVRGRSGRRPAGRCPLLPPFLSPEQSCGDLGDTR